MWDFEFHLKNHYCKKTKLDSGIENWQEDLDVWYGMPTTKQHWSKENREVSKIQTTCLRNERATSRSRDIYGSCRSQSIGWWYKSAKGRFEEDFHNNQLLDKVVAMMQKTVLVDSESIIQRVMSGLIQREGNE